MFDKESLLQSLQQSTDQLLAKIGTIPETIFNKKPAKDTWSIGQVFEHIWLVESAVNRVMLLDTQPAIERDPAQQIDFIKDAFQNFETKFQAFGPIIPSDQHKKQSLLVEKLKKSRKTLFEIINEKDLSEICLAFKHGLFGELSRGEWVYFNIYHSARHLHQVDRLEHTL
jgi:uncharacterized damage-inducible protein DinB